MAGELTTTQLFSDGEQVTSTKLNDLISQASFTASAVTGTTLTVTGGKMKVGTITASELGASSVTTPAILDDAVTTAKIADGNVTFGKLSTDDIATRTEMLAEDTGYLVTSDIVRHANGASKAYGTVGIFDANRTVFGGYHVSSASKLSTTETQINLSVTMANTAYTVTVSVDTNGTATGEASVFGKTTTSFKIKHPVEGSPYSGVAFNMMGVLAP